LKITCAGGATSIGASCILLETSTSSLVIDCGTRPGEYKSPLPDLSVLNDKNPSCIILTHAHTDHSGALPVLAEYFPHVPILATPPTIELVDILFRDSLKIMNSPEREADVPLYNDVQVKRVMENLVPIQFNEPRVIDDLTITFYQAGHILGAAMIHVASPEGNILISGDYSIGAQRTVGTAHKPSMPVDLLISESTYGERLHEERSAAETRFIGQVKSIIEGEGKVLVPTFAIGRAQEILLILKKAMRDGRLDPVPVYVDGMVKAVCNIYSGYERYVTRSLAHEIRANRHPFWGDWINPVENQSQRNEILQGGPCIIVASSGMLNGGASLFYATRILKNEHDAVLLTGYQDEESPGRLLLNLASEIPENRKITISGEEIRVKASIQIFGLSAHADRMEMAGFIDSLKPHTVLLVHGSEESRESLKKSLLCKDCISGFDGLVVERTFRKKQSTNYSDIFELPEQKDLQRIRAILGPPSSIPVKGSKIADMWFGSRVKAENIEKLVCRLVDLGVVRRDDEKANLLWVLKPSESESLQDEAALAEQVKAENPKGKLLEYCMKQNILPPVTQFKIEGGFHRVKMELTIHGTRYECVQKAAERLVAEQLAAREILALCISRDSKEIGETKLISEEEASALKTANPKGALLEYCMKQHIAPPKFEFRVIGTEWCCRAVFKSDSTQNVSNWYRSKVKTTAQHGAASEILSSCNEKKECIDIPTNDSSPVKDDTQDSGSVDTITDPKQTLNILKKRRYIIDFGFSTPEKTGPVHAPVFWTKAWAKLPDESIIESSSKSGRTKKEAERNAAGDMVNLIGNL
jgi:Cft2 family RNA processing exonuclease